jgi:hypothetical protein
MAARAVKYVVLHHGACTITRVHWRIAADGTRQCVLPETEPGAHRACVEVLLEGDADVAAPTAAQLACLRELLLELKVRYPHIEVGGHRQLRSTKAGTRRARTGCPGEHFPLADIRQWATTTLLAQHEALLEDVIADAYGPGGPRGFHRQPPSR